MLSVAYRTNESLDRDSRVRSLFFRSASSLRLNAVEPRRVLFKTKA